MTRNQKTALFLSLAIVGGAGIGVLSIPALGLVHGAAPGTARVVAGTLVVILAMAWACYFATRAHLAQDEFSAQREDFGIVLGRLDGDRRIGAGFLLLRDRRSGEPGRDARSAGADLHDRLSAGAALRARRNGRRTHLAALSRSLGS